MAGYGALKVVGPLALAVLKPLVEGAVQALVPLVKASQAILPTGAAAIGQALSKTNNLRYAPNK